MRSNVAGPAGAGKARNTTPRLCAPAPRKIYLGKRARFCDLWRLHRTTMPLWEYKHITSGPHGFANPALLEAHLNQLGKDEWEIIHYQTLPANALAFNGIARRPTTREWTLEDAAAAAAKAEAEKLRAEFAEKFRAASTPAPAGEDTKPATLDTEAASTGDLRRLRDTDRDHDPEALAEESAADDWANLGDSEDELPTFFDAIKPHLRRNQRGPGQSVAIDYLAKRWEQPEADLVGALQECGFVVPEAEDSAPEYLEFDGDLHWLNRNGRGQLFLNVREKPRAAFRVSAGKKLDPTDPAAIALAEEHAAEQAAKQKAAEDRAARQAEADARRAEQAAKREADRAARQAAGETADAAAGESAGENSHSQNDGSPAEPLPAGEALLDKIRPLMRPNRRGPGWSGSTTFLARALRCTEADLIAALGATGLAVPENSAAKNEVTELGAFAWWLNRDSRGGFWINARERRDPPSPAPASADGSAVTVAAETNEAPAAEILAPTTEPAPAPQEPSPSADGTEAAPAKKPSRLSRLASRLRPRL
jgi:hypothetical protein